MIYDYGPHCRAEKKPMNEEEYYDCYVSLLDYHRLMHTSEFLTVANYPRVDFAVSGELGKISLGYKKFLRFFRKL